MRLFLVRHGETNMNKNEVFRGRIDVELNERGIDQARKTGYALSKLNLSAVYSSPLVRALETARMIAEPHGLKVEVEEDLTDLNFGTWQGLSLKEVEEMYPDLYRLWKEFPEKVHFDNGESLDEVRQRALGVINRLAGLHKGQNVVAVSHRVVTKVLMCAFLGLDNSKFWMIKQDTCAINVVEFRDGDITVCHLNDTGHIYPFYEGMERVDF